MVTHERRRHAILRALQFWDVLVLFGVLIYVLEASLSSHSTVTARSVSAVLGWLICSAAVWHLTLAATHVYRSTRYSGRIPLIEILTGVSTAVPCLAALDLVFNNSFLRLETLVQLWLLTIMLMLATRVLLRGLLSALRRMGHNLRVVLVIGNGPRAISLVDRLRAPATGYRVLGYIDTHETPDWAHRRVPYLGQVESLHQILASAVIDEVFVALPMRSRYDAAALALRTCEEQGISVHMPCDLFPQGIGSQTYNVAAGIPFLSAITSPKSPGYLLAKRTIDIAACAVLLLLLTPLFLLVAAAIKLDSPGPALFVQTRVGLNKRLFRLYKFRTMHIDSEVLRDQLSHLNEANGPVFKIRNDPRVTRIGKWLRKTSIDELPQLLNVLRGDMTLVGPRPLPLRDVEGFTIDWQRRRFSVLPGITCLWQVSGRSKISFDQWMELDMQYIDQRNLTLDILILLRTIPAVLRQTGAH